MKNPKIIYHISWIFALVSLVCIGFSTWNITNQVVESQSLAGSIKADNVINSSEYIDFVSNITGTGNDFDSFTYTDIGFVDDNNTPGTLSDDRLVSAGRITAHYKLRTGKCNELLKLYGDNALKVECTLVGTNESGALDIFTTIPNVRQVKGEVEYDVLQEEVRITDEKTVATQSTATYSFIISNISPTSTGDHTINISFKFEVTPGAGFTNNFYNKLGLSPEFTFYMRISGVAL